MCLLFATKYDKSALRQRLFAVPSLRRLVP
jgi:hypothetical protein